MRPGARRARRAGRPGGATGAAAGGAARGAAAGAGTAAGAAGAGSRAWRRRRRRGPPAGQRLGPGQQLRDVGAGGQHRALEQRHLERVAGLVGELHLEHRPLGDVEEPGHLGRVGQGGERLHVAQLGLGQVERDARGEARHGGVAEEADQLLGHAPHLQPALVEGGHLGEQRRGVAPHQRRRHPRHRSRVDHAERLGHRVVARLVAAGGPHPVEQRERVAHAPLRGPGDQRERRSGELHPLRRGHLAQLVGDLAQVEPAEVEALAAGDDGLRDLVDVGGGEHEDHVRRRLLQRLQAAR